jgi:2-C-methyl-D-erythritol 2,4-cyclodiphosphate synthase
LIDALLGAAALGDIGTLFPSTDETPGGIDSIDMLSDASSRVEDAGYGLVNADCILIGEEPRVAANRATMEERLSRAARGPVTVRATTTDRLGFTGRGEGLAAQAVALLERR